jgi:hypothetical protein
LLQSGVEIRRERVRVLAIGASLEYVVCELRRNYAW